MAVVVVAVLVLRGGGGGGNDEKQVRASLAGFTQAIAQKDYQAICQRYLATNLLDQLAQIQLSCRRALARSTLGSVQSPTLTVTGVKITGTTALADVHSGAAGQKPLDGTMELIREGGLWRIRSLPSRPAKKP